MSEFRAESMSMSRRGCGGVTRRKIQKLGQSICEMQEEESVKT